MPSEKTIETFTPVSRHAWRKWLLKNHQVKASVWLICYKKSSGKKAIPWSDLVEEALCFGWIDSVRKSLGAEQFMQFYTKRKPKSGWSKINKAKIKQLTANGLMMPAGLASIARAKQNGSWSALDAIEKLIVPADLTTALKAHAGAHDFFSGLSKSVRKAMLHWVVSAKRTHTRQKRITEIVELAAQQKRPKQF